MDDSTTKRCTKCGADKPLIDFYHDKRYTDGWYPWCARCRRDYRAARNADPSKVQQRKAYERRYYQENKDAIAPHRRVYDRARWHSDPEHRARKNQQKRDLIRKSQKWQQKIRLRGRFYRQQRRAREKALGQHFTKQEWDQLCERYNHCCLACGKRCPLTADHIVPLSRGGSNTIDNIQPLCDTCNKQKHTKTIDYRPDGGSV